MKLRTLNVQAPSSFTRRLIAESLPRFLHTHHGLRVVVWDMNPADEMLAQGADAAICIGPITNPDFVVNHIGTVRSITCASPKFIDCRGVPPLPSDIRPDHCIAVLEAGARRAREWRFRRKSESYAICPTAPLAFSNGEAAIAAAVRGGGYARVLCIDAEQQIAAGLLLSVLNEWNDDSQPVSMVHTRHASKDVLAFRAFMASIMPSHMTRHFALHHSPGRTGRTFSSEPIALKQSIEPNVFF